MENNTQANGEVNPKPPAVSGKLPRVLKPDPKKVLQQRLLSFGLILAGVLILVVSIIHFAPKAKKTIDSNTLTSTISNLKKTSNCNNGVKQLNPNAAQWTTSNQYTRPAREQVLDYLVNCEFVNGNNKQALTYATELQTMYQQDGSNQKLAQLNQMITYIKSYNGSGK